MGYDISRNFKSLLEIPEVKTPDVVTVFDKDQPALGHRLLLLPKNCKVMVVADLNGDFVALQRILQQTEVEQRLRGQANFLLLFVGNVCDEQGASLQCWESILQLIDAFPEKVFVTQGKYKSLPVEENQVDGDVKNSKVRFAFSDDQGLFALLHKNVIDNLPIAAIDAASGTVFSQGGISQIDEDVEYLGDFFNSQKRVDQLTANDSLSTESGRLYRFAASAVMQKLNADHNIRYQVITNPSFKETHSARAGEIGFCSRGDNPQIMLLTTGIATGRFVVNFNDSELPLKLGNFFDISSCASAGKQPY
jgi:hypothetical protein